MPSNGSATIEGLSDKSHWMLGLVFEPIPDREGEQPSVARPFVGVPLNLRARQLLKYALRKCGLRVRETKFFDRDYADLNAISMAAALHRLLADSPKLDTPRARRPKMKSAA